MRILAVDTSTSAATAAVLDNNSLLSECMSNHKKAHSQKIMLLVDAALRNSGLKPSDIDAFACSSGPGSFTGLRIGASVAKGMAQTMKKPVIGVPTLDALAYNFYNCSGFICPILDAQRNMVYSALYLWEGGELKKLEDFGAILVDELINKLGEYDKSVTFLGDGVLLYEGQLQEKVKKCVIAPPSHLLPRASSCAVAAQHLYEEGKVVSYDAFSLHYIRKSQAEVEYEKKNQVELSDMKLEDIDGICEIENLSFQTPWSRESFVEELESNQLSRYIVAKKDGKVVGYGGMWAVLDEGHITNIAVHPDYRRQKIGEKIVQALVDRAKEEEIDKLTLEVRKSNTPAIILYRKFGFEECGVRKGYYADTGEDALIMWSDI